MWWLCGVISHEKAIRRLAPDDKGARPQALMNAGRGLLRLGIAHHVDLGGGARAEVQGIEKKGEQTEGKRVSRNRIRTTELSMRSF